MPERMALNPTSAATTISNSPLTPRSYIVNHTSKADKIRAIIAEQPNAKAKEIVEALAAKKVRVTLPQV